jgi:imidazolonepropionase
VARRLGRELPLTVKTTGLAAHALPPEFDGRADDYVDAVCAWLPQWHAEGLLDAVDAFCERIAFTPAQTRRVFDAARALALPVKLHAEQLSDQGGAALAAGYGALSCDHLEWLSADGVQAMAAAGTVAVLLPGAYYFLRDTQLPPVQALREAGVPMAVATDHNPGSSPALSMPLMLNMACTLFRLTPEEALRGATVHAARALGLADRGTLEAGRRADFAVWDLDHPAELAYWFGHTPCRRSVAGGQERR